MQGMCSLPPPENMAGASENGMWRNGQCVLLADATLLVAMYCSLWMHNLYISLRQTRRSPARLNELIITGNSQREDSILLGSLWMTRSAAEGHRHPVKAGAAVRVLTVHNQLAVSGAMPGPWPALPWQCNGNSKVALHWGTLRRIVRARALGTRWYRGTVLWVLMVGCCCADACMAAVLIGVMRLPGCPFGSAWSLVCEVCRLGQLG